MNFHEGHPESVDPPWFQELVRRAYDREVWRLMALGNDAEEAVDQAMWYVFELRSNLTALYQAGSATNE
jgi:hypothetical protein